MTESRSPPGRLRKNLRRLSKGQAKSDLAIRPGRRLAVVSHPEEAALMQRIFNVDKWWKVSQGEALEFPNEKKRNVRLEVNTPNRAALWLIDQESEEPYFLALVEGRETIEFGTTGKMALSVEGGDVWIFTADSDDPSVIILAPRIFTKIYERRRRNPEFELMMHKMQENMERRLAQQANELAWIVHRERTANGAGGASPADGYGGEPRPGEPASTAATDAGGIA